MPAESQPSKRSRVNWASSPKLCERFEVAYKKLEAVGVPHHPHPAEFFGQDQAHSTSYMRYFIVNMSLLRAGLKCVCCMVALLFSVII